MNVRARALATGLGHHARAHGIPAPGEQNELQQASLRKVVVRVRRAGALQIAQRDHTHLAPPLGPSGRVRRLVHGNDVGASTAARAAAVRGVYGRAHRWRSRDS